MHNLETTATGEVAMFCTGDRKAAWHLLGQRTPNAVTWKEAMSLAFLNWSVSKHAIEMVNPVTGKKEILRDTFGIFRDTDGQYLGHVGKEYTPIQNEYAFNYVDALLESTGSHYESAGSLGHGERIWCMARLPRNIVIAGTEDICTTYLLFTNAHNGSASGTVKLTSTRTVCENTLNMALEGPGAQMFLRHTTQIKQRMEDAKAMMTGAIQNVESLEAKFNALAEKQMTKDSMLEVLALLFPIPSDGKAVTRRERIIMKVLDLFESNDNNAIPQIRGSAYNLLNAVTEYTDHFRIGVRKGTGTLEAARANSAIFGSGDELKTRALNVITKVTATNPTRGAAVMVAAPAVQVLELEPEAAPEVPAEVPTSPVIQSIIDATVERILSAKAPETTEAPAADVPATTDETPAAE